MSTNGEELVQTMALWLTKEEAVILLNKVQGCPTFITYGVEVYMVPAGSMPMPDGSVKEAVNVMVRAETEMQAGIGKGFLLALFWKGR